MTAKTSTHYRRRAAKLRELAGAMKHPESAISLIAIAEQYERLAEQVDDAPSARFEHVPSMRFAAHRGAG